MTLTPKAPKELPISWLNVTFLASVHLLAAGGLVAYLLLHGLSLAALVIGMTWTTLTILSISAGYHRLFSHRTFEAHPVLRFLLLAFGASAFQNSALEWSADHRRHHTKVDTDLDPYDVRRGFWHSHIGWVLRKGDPTIVPAPVRDLEADPMIVWQKRHYMVLATLVGLVAPWLLGLACGDPWGGLLLGGVVRLVLSYQATFSINSFAHMIGVQPYSDRDSSRDSFVTALVSMGEGYHNFHHAFPGDYRNGVRAHQFDPTKWMVRALATVGITRNLRKTPTVAVIRARLRMEARQLEGIALPAATGQRLERARETVEAALARLHVLISRYEAVKKEAGAHWALKLHQVREDVRAARVALRVALQQWHRAIRAPEVLLAV